MAFSAVPESIFFYLEAPSLMAFYKKSVLWGGWLLTPVLMQCEDRIRMSRMLLFETREEGPLPTLTF